MAKKHTAKMTPTVPKGKAAESQTNRDRFVSMSPDVEGYEDEIDAAAVTKPVSSMVHSRMRSGWRIDNRNPMWLIFDVVSPVRTFKTSMPYDEDADFPEFDPEALEEITEIDQPSKPLMPYDPIDHQSTYHFKCEVTEEQFMDWRRGELRSFQIGTLRKRPKKQRATVSYRDAKIRAPYDRIVAQLVKEDEHGEMHNTHESHRRQSYAKRVLDEFGAEFTAYKGSAKDFRSQVLSPILARQLVGIPDSYSPSIEAGILKGEGEVTIGMATDLYLSADPTDFRLIPGYRYNAVHTPEVRWHLAVVMGNINVGDSESYNDVRTNQDRLMAAYQTSPIRHDATGDEPPLFNTHMVSVVLKEGLGRFFKPELDLVAETNRQSHRRKDGPNAVAGSSKSVQSGPARLPPVQAVHRQPSPAQPGPSQPRVVEEQSQPPPGHKRGHSDGGELESSKKPRNQPDSDADSDSGEKADEEAPSRSSSRVEEHLEPGPGLGKDSPGQTPDQDGQEDEVDETIEEVDDAVAMEDVRRTGDDGGGQE